MRAQTALQITLAATVALSLPVSEARAEAGFVPQLPNVYNVPNNQTGCGLCHVNPYGDGPRNPFGLSAQAHITRNSVNWTAICALDPDGDGFTNGEEMGDPGCVWSQGQPNPVGEITDPRDPNSHPAAMMTGGEMAGEMGGYGMTGGVIGGAPLFDMGLLDYPESGTAEGGSMVAGNPEAGTNAAGTPVAGTPVAGTPAAGTPAAGTPAAGTPAAGTPAASNTTEESGCTSSPSRSLPALPLLGLLVGFFAIRARRERA